MLQVVWVEIPVKDIERALKFYQAVFEFQPSDIRDDGVRRTSTMVNTSPEGHPGVSLTQNPSFPTGDKGVFVYFNAEDELTPYLSRVEPAGGKIVEPKTSMGDAGHYASILDTEGNLIALYSVR